MVLPSTVAAGPTRMAVHIESSCATSAADGAARAVDAPSAMSAAVVLMAVAAVVDDTGMLAKISLSAEAE